MKQVVVRLEELRKQCEDIAFKLNEAWQAVLPQLLKLYKEIVRVYTGILNLTIDLAMVYVKAALDVINEHQKELKELAVMASELTQDVAKIIFKATSQIKKDVDEFIVMLIDQMKVLPIYEIVKEKYDEILKFQVPESVIGDFNEFCNAIKHAMPTQELREFFEAIQQYILKYAKHEKVSFSRII